MALAEPRCAHHLVDLRAVLLYDAAAAVVVGSRWVVPRLEINGRDLSEYFAEFDRACRGRPDEPWLGLELYWSDAVDDVWPFVGVRPSDSVEGAGSNSRFTLRVRRGTEGPAVYEARDLEAAELPAELIFVTAKVRNGDFRPLAFPLFGKAREGNGCT